ncbi:hypothetical protein [Clostridium sp.]|uniref:hypothetical protein n=1 Tax=Clostridium sp. TaxID=1506 RepID=UPI001D9CE803|nr:hypothetical protein [Clostridium sp.]MBS5938592.1 hypothetical protein [Clostridium sp.]
MPKLSENEYPIVHFKATKVSNAEGLKTAATVITNLLSHGIAGSGTTSVVLTLTEDNLYIEHVGYAPTGQMDTFVTEKVDRKEINSFDVVKEENTEVITISYGKSKYIKCVRDNKDLSNLPTEIAKFIS